VDVTVAKSGDCTGLALRYSRKAGFPYPSGQEQVTLFGASSTITFQAIPTERWEDGDHPLRLYDTVRAVYMVSTETLVVT
jgi:hypothetical protein